MKKIISYSFLLTIVFSSCKKENTIPEYNSSLKGKLTVEFDNIVGSQDLQLNTGNYTNSSGQSYKVTKLKYYVSNFKFTNVDGSVYTVPQDSSYFLIEEGNPARQKATFSLPEGDYKAVSYTIGVDSLRNTMNISNRTGDLDVTGAASDMYWSWNSGYIFFKFEGTSPVITGMGSAFQYHVGGFGGYTTATANNLKNVTIDLTARGTGKVKSTKPAGVNLHLFVDLNKVFTGVNTISLATLSMAHSINAGVPIAANLPAIFSHDHTEN